MAPPPLILSPDEYARVSTYDLLRAAEWGYVGIDHWFLHAIVDHPDQSIPDLVRYGLEDHEDAPEDLTQALFDIVSHLGRLGCAPLLVHWLREGAFELSVPILLAFRRVGEAAVEPLLGLYEETKDDEDSEVGYILSNLGVRDPRILQVLIERLEIDPVDAGHCLAIYGDPAAAPALRSVIDRAGEFDRQSLQEALHRLGTIPEPLEDEPFDLWSLYPDAADPVFLVMEAAEREAFLDSPHGPHRYAAVHDLRQREVSRHLWDRLLQMARKDPEPEVCRICWETLSGPASERREIREALRAAVEDASQPAEARVGALVALGELGGEEPQFHHWALEYYNRPQTRGKALQAMAFSLDPRFDPYFSRHLDDPDSGVRLQAIQGIGLLEITPEAERLVPLFNHEEFREEALMSYALCARAEPTRRAMRKLYDTIERLSGGLSEGEEESVQAAINVRAARYELGAIFDEHGELIIERAAVVGKVGRNDPCPCGSGKKYKKCCGA